MSSPAPLPAGLCLGLQVVDCSHVLVSGERVASPVEPGLINKRRALYRTPPAPPEGKSFFLRKALLEVEVYSGNLWFLTSRC